VAGAFDVAHLKAIHRHIGEMTEASRLSHISADPSLFAGLIRRCIRART
jgi:hypothetical protein